MANFRINVVSDKEDKRVPIELAGKTMVNVQNLLTHIGEYLMCKELHIQRSLNPKLAEKMTIYVDSMGSVSLSASSKKPDTKGYGNVIEDSAVLFEKTLDAACSENAMEWFEETFQQGGSKTKIINDVLALYEDVWKKEGFKIMYGSTEIKTFQNVNVSGLQNLIKFTMDSQSYGEIPIGEISFNRIFATNGDVELKTPLVASVSSEPGKYTLKNDDLGIEVTKATWDEAVQQFHDYFVFYWLQYADKDDSELVGEEKETKDFLKKLVA